ncbi:hypothetical protein GCM10011309_18080 [Litorimonas cladophorae]|uniref:DUF885 domain-containing protein n=1 Tax=Litorimonas cladophorae TaxID=1220491 RepID=A0A918KMA9_9PROT|nr:DUF885 domain-containing protein [Litorimonas cladophorae]GGX68637.1 hypothetical protein GCM10011309_18080 [Litorimonas cladophorae]
MRRLLPILLLSAALPFQAHGQQTQSQILPICPGGEVIELDGEFACKQDDTLALLIADFEAAELDGDIYRRGQEGDREALKQLPDISPEADAAANEKTMGFLARHAALSKLPMTDDDRLNHTLLGFVLTQRQRLAPFDSARVPFTNDSGFFNELGFIVRRTDFDTIADYEAYAARLTRLPRYFAQAKENMRRGIRTKFTASAEILPGIQEMIDAMAETSATAHPLFAPFKDFPESISVEDQTRLRGLGKAALESAAIPAYRDLSKFMRDEYASAARQTAGLGNSEEEREYYRALTRYFTTLDMGPDEVHALGLSEVVRIRREMDAVIAEVEFKGSFAEFLEFLRTDPQFYATTREELLMHASFIAKKLDGKMPEYFETLPRLSYGVIPVPREIEKSYTTGRYFSGDPDRGQAGNYVVNTYNLPNRPLYNLPALTAHEGVPGHHMQIAIGQELKGLPKFRKSLYPNAFGEGWGLYAEKLAGEMGIYTTPYERFGQLSYEMWRACRLVVDTGLHWKGWTREEAEACFLENSALAPHNIKTEVQRYISWPGQALAYKVGELKILELRAKTEDALGDDFDIRRFHDAVLSGGGIPLDILETRIDRFIFDERRRLNQLEIEAAREAQRQDAPASAQQTSGK